MCSLAKFFSIACLVGASFHGCSARLCVLQGLDGLVSSQADVNNKIKNCTSVQGSIIIASDYEGRFFLDGLSDLTGIQTQQPRNGSKSNTGFIGLTSVDVDGPAYIESIEIRDAPFLRSISVSNTTSIDKIAVSGAGGLDSVAFGSLLTASSISIQNASRIDFPVLATIKTSLEIGNDTLPSGVLGYRQAFEYTLYTPSLRSAGYIHLAGQFQDISMPLLSTFNFIAPSIPEGYRPTGLTINAVGSYFDVQVASLQMGENFHLSGPIPNASFTSLRNVTNFELDSTVPVSVDLSSLATANYLELNGTFTNLSLAHHFEVPNLRIQSQNTSSCNIAQDAYNNARGANYHGEGYESELYCANPSRAHSGLSKKTKLALGLGLGLGLGTLLISAAIFWYKYSNFLKRNSGPTVVQNGGRREQDHELPPYKPREEERVPGVTPNEPPPDYEHHTQSEAAS